MVHFKGRGAAGAALLKAGTLLETGQNGVQVVSCEGFQRTSFVLAEFVHFTAEVVICFL